MGLTRRDLLKLTSGSAAGLVFTPVPWSLLRDTAIRSENWPGVPQPPRGEIHTRYTTCTLCPAACAVRARCVGDQPVSLAGVPGHAAGGTLCTNGLVGHHLTFCDGRVTQPLSHGKAVSLDRAVAEIRAAMAACGRDESIAILDMQPGRVSSAVYRRFLAGLPNGLHCSPASARPYGPFGIDLENTRAILSFGVPVLDGWLSPARVLAQRSHFHLIQVEPIYSHTASLADWWIPVAPGQESAFAEDVARALKGASAGAPATEVAHRLQQHAPAIAIGHGAGELNAILGSIGRAGGFLRHRDDAPFTDLANIPDGSVRVLLTDESDLPWSQIEPKLTRRNAVVVALTPWLDGCAAHADYVIPAPVYLESLDETPTPAGATAAGFSLSPALLPSRPGAITPADFILRLAQDSSSYADALKQRAAQITKEGHGTIFSYTDGKSTRVREIASANDLWKSFLAGASWSDDPLPQTSAHLPAPSAKTVDPPAHNSPLMSKLYRESGLRRPANAAVLNPETARAQGLKSGSHALVDTVGVQVVLDPSAPPGIVDVAGRAMPVSSIRRVSL